ncbi:MAG: glycosyl transferase group 1 [Verrucomicrobiales bacterium]|nr:glycosyl transferase group 1 [Verrucomicrobiales bacterium]
MNGAPRRILMTADTVGGVWTYALELASALDNYDVQVALATMGGLLNRDQRRQLRDLRNVQVIESEFKLEWMQDPWADVEKAGEWLLGLDDDVRPDLIHLNNYAHGALPWSAPTVMVGHSCVLSWWQTVRRSPISPEWKRYGVEVAKGLQSADVVIAPSRDMLDRLKSFYGPLRRSRVIYNARHPGLFAPQEKEQIILTAGRVWDEAKNVSTLLEVAPDLPWPVCIAGEDKHPDKELTNRPRDKTKNVKLLGRLGQDKMAYWLGRASIYAAPAVYEPFGLSILEAALSGCALVLSDIPTLREIWGQVATFVPPNDTAAWKSALKQLIDNPAKHKENAAHAQCRAIQFNPHQFGAEYMSVYREVLAVKREEQSRRNCADQNVLSHAVV